MGPNDQPAQMSTHRNISKHQVGVALLLAASTASAAYLAPIDNKALPLTAHMQRAHKVEVLAVKTGPDALVNVAARLTFADGATAECEYTMSTKITMVDGQSGIQFVPQSETCASQAH